MLSIKNMTNELVNASGQHLDSRPTRSIMPRSEAQVTIQPKHYGSHEQTKRLTSIHNTYRKTSAPRSLSADYRRHPASPKLPPFSILATPGTRASIRSVELPSDAVFFERNLQQHKARDMNTATSVDRSANQALDLKTVMPMRAHLDHAQIVQLTQATHFHENLFAQVAHFDHEGLITNFEQIATMSKADVVQAMDIHQNCMSFLEQMEFFQNFKLLQDIGLLTPKARQILKSVPKEAEPLLIAPLALKREVAILLNVEPILYKTLKNIEIARKYFSEQAPFDNAEQRQVILSTLDLGNLSAPKVTLSDQQICLNRAYQFGFEKLQLAEASYEQALFSRNPKQLGLIHQANALEKLPLNEAEREQAISKRDELIEQLFAQTQVYLQILCEVVKDIEQYGGGCIVPGFDSAEGVEQERNKYLDKLHKKITSHVLGERNILGQKKTKFSELCNFFESNQLLPEIYGIVHFSTLTRLRKELQQIYQQASHVTKAWASDAITAAFSTQYDPKEIMSESARTLQIEKMQESARQITKKWQTIGELPLFSGDGAQEVEKAVDALYDAGLFCMSANTSTSTSTYAHEQSMKKSLDGLLIIGALAPAAHREMTNAPEYMREYMLKALGLKQVIADHLLANPVVIDKLKQLYQIHQYLANQAPFAFSEEQLKQAHQIYPCDEYAIQPDEVKHNRAYRTAAEAFFKAQQVYQQTLFHPIGEQQPSLWNYALQLRKKPDDVLKVPERYACYLDEREKTLERIWTAIENYLDTTLSALQELEATGTRIGFSAQTYDQKMQAYLDRVADKAIRHLDRETSLKILKKVPFASLLKAIEDAELLPESDGYIALSIPKEIDHKLREVTQQAKKNADIWLFNAGLKTLNEECNFAAQANTPTEKEQLKIVQAVSKKITDEVEALKREEINKIKKMSSQGGGFIAGLLNAIDTIQIMNEQYDWEVAMRRRYKSVQGGGGARHDEYDNYDEYIPINFFERPDRTHARNAYSPPTSTAVMKTNGNDSHASLSNRSQLCRELGLSSRATDLEINRTRRQVLFQCHPENARNRALPNELRMQNQERYKLISALSRP